jgi:hypothetical protein
MGTGDFLIRYFNNNISISPIKEAPRLFLTKHYSFNKKIVNFKLAVKEMYPQILWELVVDPLGSAGQTLGTTALDLASDNLVHRRVCLVN